MLISLLKTINCLVLKPVFYFFTLVQSATLPMTGEPRNEFPNQFRSQIKRFELMVKEDQVHFIDIDEMELVTSHYMDTFQYKKAIVALNIGISQHPFSSILLLWKTQVLISQNNINEAIESLVKVEVLEPTNSEMLLLKGVINSRKKYHRDAINCFKESIANMEEPDDEPYLCLAEEYKILDQHDLAKEMLEKALRLDPENFETIMELAMCCDIVKNFKRSIKLYNIVLDQEPYSYLNWFNLGMAYFNLGKIEKSIESFDFAIVIKDDFSSAYFSKACSLASLDEYEEAIEVYKETFKHESPESITYYSIAECYEELDDLENAFNYYKNCTTLDPLFADGWIGMSATTDFEKNAEGAVSYIRKAITLEPTCAQYWHIYAEVNSKLNYTHTALNAYRKALKLDPDSEAIWIHYANFLIEQKKLNDAIILIQKGVDWMPENASFYYILTSFLLIDDCIPESLYFLSIGLSLDYDLHYLVYQHIPSAKNISVARNMIDSYL